MGFFDELKREMKKSFIEGMRGEAIDEDEDIDSMDIGSELVKEAFKSAREDSYDNKIKKSSNNYCPKCGAKHNNEALFCSKCGKKIVFEIDDEYQEEDDEEDEDYDD